MIPSKGSVRPNTKRSSSRPAPGIRSEPIAKPAIVEITSAIGTTASTMNTLDARSALMFATLNASRKFPHWGSAGNDRPTGTLPDGYSAVVKMLTNGRIVIATSASSRARPA